MPERANSSPRRLTQLLLPATKRKRKGARFWKPRLRDFVVHILNYKPADDLVIATTDDSHTHVMLRGASLFSHRTSRRHSSNLRSRL